MARRFRYLTHTQVRMDPHVPVPDWGLSDVGRRRAAEFAQTPFLHNTKTLVCSAEQKARDTAEIVAKAIGVAPIIVPNSHENDRSATGYLEPDEFERVADAFFATPEKSVRGWERAIDAQSRIVGAFEQVVNDHPIGDVLMVGHGGVGTLLLCHLAGFEISRAHDQAPGGGSMLEYDLRKQALVHGWQTIEELQSHAPPS